MANSGLVCSQSGVRVPSGGDALGAEGAQVHLLAGHGHGVGRLHLGVAARVEEGAGRLGQQGAAAQEGQAGGESCSGCQGRLRHDRRSEATDAAASCPMARLPHSTTLRDTAALVAAGLRAGRRPRAALDGGGRALRRRHPAGPAGADRHARTIRSGRQFIPAPGRAASPPPHERPDPIGDDALSPVPGIVHRYADRALLKPLLVCPVYCRFCFRREHVGPDGGLLSEAELAAAWTGCARTPAISEVILTGGDPLMLSPRRLGAILAALDGHPACPDPAHPHARAGGRPGAADGRAGRRRWRPTNAALAGGARQPCARVHAGGAWPRCARVQRRGVPLLGQSVLLRGVNDSAAALEALFRAMLAARVKPYYLHQLDAAPGTARFHVPIAEGQAPARRRCAAG